MIYLMVVIVSSMATVFFLALRGLGGALVLGFDLLALDFFWQWMRYRSLQSGNRDRILNSTLKGFVLRMVSVLSIVKLATWWLKPEYITVFACTILILPILNLFEAFWLRQKGI